MTKHLSDSTATAQIDTSSQGSPLVLRDQRATVDAQQLYTAQETADILRCSTKTLERWRAEGRGPLVTRLWQGGRPLYRGTHIIDAIERAVIDRPGRR